MLSVTSASTFPPVPGTPSPERQNVADLAKSLRSGNLDGARNAYANIIRNRPEGASWQAGSPFADLGKALVQGDMDAARTAFSAMIQARIGPQPIGSKDMSSPDAATAATPSTTGGAAGGLLSTVA